MNFKELKKDPKYANLTKKKIKKELRKGRIVPEEKKHSLAVKKKKQSKKIFEREFQRSLKKNFITDGLCENETPMDIPMEHGEMRDTRDGQVKSRYVHERNQVLTKLKTAPTIIVDLDFKLFKDKKSWISLVNQLGVMHSLNTKYAYPIRILTTGIQKEIRRLLVKKGAFNWVMSFSQQNLEKVIEPENVVYLTDAADDVLTEFDPLFFK